MKPTTLLARVYLTTDTADFMHYRLTGTLAPRSVAQAAAFPLDVAPREAPDSELSAPAQQQQAITAALERIFDELNEEPSTGWAQAYRADGNRSLSVGDVVVLGETAWVVAPIGYERVSTEDLATAIVPTDRAEQLSPRESAAAEARQWAQMMAQRLRARPPAETAASDLSL